ncbi:MAG: hypothetical protein EPN88_14370 [Bacteroidetes bacterium]|nr:MAG: hypothetical protein EPN88_14370 [Bacteroidota bacterium]
MDQFSTHPLYRRHNIDSVMNSLWEFYKTRFFSLFLISLAMSLVMQYASTFLNFKELQSITDPMLIFEKMKGYIVPILIISLVNLLFTTILQHYILYNPIDSGNNIFVSIMSSLKYFIPYLIIMVLLVFAGSIAIVLGLLALIVGVFFSILYIMTIYLFVLPVMMVEGANIGNTISRTLTLAHRNFWSNIGWVAVFLIIVIITSVILSSIILLPFAGSFLRTIFNPAEATTIINVTTKPLFIILSAAVNALILPVMPVFACILYFNGKAREEQVQTINPANPENEKVKVEDLYAKPYSDDHPENPEKTSDGLNV